MFGDKLEKITKWTFGEEGLFESDINPEVRTLIDHYTNSDKPSKDHRVLFLDIEVESSKGFPQWSNPVQNITSIACCIKGRYIVFVLDPEKFVTLKSTKQCEIRTFDTESDLLNNFLKWMIVIRPTIISGWNIDGFDIPYMYNRMQYIDPSRKLANSLSPINIVEYNEYFDRYRIAGISTLDYMFLYKKYSLSESPTYKLDYIGNKEVGISKVKYNGDLNTLYQDDRNLFIKYNVNDVRILEKMEEKLKFIQISIQVAHKGHVPYEDVFFQSRPIDGAILTYLKRNNIVAPDAVRGLHEEKIKGAFVKYPTPGLYDWIFDFDAKSLYPSVIMSLNISPETKIGVITNWDISEYNKGSLSTIFIKMIGHSQQLALSRSDFEQRKKDEEWSVAMNGVIYSQRKPGIIPMVIDNWYQERNKYKKLKSEAKTSGDKKKATEYDNTQYTLKILQNSLYGVLLLPSFRFFDRDNGLAVTSTGQALIRFAITAGNLYFNKKTGTKGIDYCLYGDTDSTFYSATHLVPGWEDLNEIEMLRRVREECKLFQDAINGHMDYFASKFIFSKNHRFYFDQEIIAKAGLLVTKKRYGLRVIETDGVADDTPIIKGLDIVRSTYPELFQIFLKRILLMILDKVEKPEIDAEIDRFKHEYREKEFGVIATPTGIKNVEEYTDSYTLNPVKGSPGHVVAAINYNKIIVQNNLTKRYKLIESNDKIRWTYLKENPRGITQIAFRDDDNIPKIVSSLIGDYIDYDRIDQKLIDSKVEMFYGPLGWHLVNSSVGTLDEFLE